MQQAGTSFELSDYDVLDYVDRRDFKIYKSLLYKINWIKFSSPQTQAGKHSISNG